MAQLSKRVSNRISISLVAATILATMLLGLSPLQAASAVRVSLERRIDGTAAPIITAQARGLFKAEGLDVILDAAKRPSEALDRVGHGESDIAIVDFNALIRFRDQPNAPRVQAVYIFQNRAGYAIAARKSRGISTLADLKGKRLGVAEGDLAINAWPGVALKNGVEPTKVIIEKMAAAVREPMLSAGEVDAVSGLSFGSGLNVKDRGVPASDLTVLKFADLGSRLYGQAVAVNPAFASAHPSDVRAFLQAITKGILLTIKDPGQAITDVLAQMDNGIRDLELDRLKLVLQDNIVTPDVTQNGLGTIDPERFAASLDEIAAGYKFHSRPSLSDIFNDQFLPPLAARKIN